MADLQLHSTVKRMSTNQSTEWIQADGLRFVWTTARVWEQTLDQLVVRLHQTWPIILPISHFSFVCQTHDTNNIRLRLCTVHPQSPPLTIGGTVLKELITMQYWEWHFIPRWLLRNIFIRFSEQLLKGVVSWGSPGEYSMIGQSLLGRCFRRFALLVFD